MLAAISDAQKSVYLEMYIVSDDTKQSHDFIGKLKEKSQQGVQVILVADAYGSRNLKEKLADELRRAGIEIHFFSNWLRHIHRKVLIIDKEVAFIGGVNITKKATHWKDLQLRITGRIVRRILKSFAYAYGISGGKNKAILAIRDKKFSVKLRFWLVEHWPSQNIYTLKDHYIQKISSAQKSVRIVTPYLAPPRWLISLLDGAIKRGVHVEILLPERADVPFMDRVNYRYAHELHTLGVTFYLSEEMNHAKLLLIDDTHGLIGSQNIDLATFSLNAETGLFFSDKTLVKELRETLEDWKKASSPFRPEHFRMRPIDWIILLLMKIFRPIL